MSYQKKIHKVINLRNVKILVGVTEMEKKPDKPLNMAQYVRITSTTNSKTTIR